MARVHLSGVFQPKLCLREQCQASQCLCFTTEEPLNVHNLSPWLAVLQVVCVSCSSVNLQPPLNMDILSWALESSSALAVTGPDSHSDCISYFSVAVTETP